MSACAKQGRPDREVSTGSGNYIKTVSSALAGPCQVQAHPVAAQSWCQQLVQTTPVLGHGTDGGAWVQQQLPGGLSSSAVSGQRCAHAGLGEWAACLTPSSLTKACNEQHGSILVHVKKLMRVQKGNHCICICGLHSASLPCRLNVLPKSGVLLLSPVGTSPRGR